MPANKHSRKHAKGGKYWAKDVKTVSTYPPEGLFTRSPQEVARGLASKNVSPKGPVSGLRMPTFFVNCAGKGLSKTRRANLEKAKEILSHKIKQQKNEQKKAA